MEGGGAGVGRGGMERVKREERDGVRVCWGGELGGDLSFFCKSLGSLPRLWFKTFSRLGRN